MWSSPRLAVRPSALAAVPLLLLAVTHPCLAKDGDKLLKLVRSAGTDPLVFLQQLHTLGDVNLDANDMRKVLNEVGAPAKGPLRKLLGPATRLRVRKGQVTLDRREKTTLEMTGGVLQLGKQVRFSLSKRGKGVVLSRPKGIKVGRHRSSLYSLKKVEFVREGKLPVAMVTAGVGFFTRTVRIPLAQSPTKRPKGNHRGAAGALGALR